MSVADAVVSANVGSTAEAYAGWQARSTTLQRVALGGVALLLIVSPFEALQPLLRIPGQSLSTVETALFLVCAACAAAALASRTWPQLPWADTLPWIALVVAAFVSASVASEFRLNALHMAARLAMAFVVWGLTVMASRTDADRYVVACVALAAGTLVGLLVIADFAAVPPVVHVLGLFRSGIAIVGAQVRASGPFQYPTIASMYLEGVFALGLGVVVASSARVRSLAIVALAIVAEAIILTFTRAGLITMGLSLVLVGGLRWRHCRSDPAFVSIAALTLFIIAELVSSRSAEMLVLRMTSEGQGRWFSARIQTPSLLTVDTTQPIRVPITITNTGRATWDSRSGEPILLSYHWVADDSDEVIAWEGTRTPFAEPVRPGQTVQLSATVGGPGRPGHFRLMWDLEQVHRLWFSSEPDAVPVFAEGVVSGPTISTRSYRGSQRIPRTEVRPGRLALWRAALRMWAAQPVLGVGPDNFRLLYGRYSNLRTADPRVHSNNMYIEVLAGTGLLGFAALLWGGVRTARAARLSVRGRALGAGVCAACLACAVHGLVDSFLSFTGTYILIAVAFGLASASAQDDSCHAHRV